MKATNILEAFDKARKRVHVVGDLDAGVIIALDMEGRLFTVFDGEVLNRVNFDAIEGESTQKQYLNPGGDGLWPAPEGTSLGYQYSTGVWRVSPGLRAARYLVAQSTNYGATVLSEVDLVNSQGLGVPTIFKRQINVVKGIRSVDVHVVESITYIGSTPLQRADCLLAPWTLCQFDCGLGCEVVFPCAQKSFVWDLYDEASNTERDWNGGLCRTATNGSQHYQIAMDEKVPWIEFHDPRCGLVVRRKADPLPAGQGYIDIRDVAPDVAPSRKGVRYSVYSDTANFMEIEAVGGCPDLILPNTEMSIAVSTRFVRT